MLWAALPANGHILEDVQYRANEESGGGRIRGPGSSRTPLRVLALTRKKDVIGEEVKMLKSSVRIPK